MSAATVASSFSSSSILTDTTTLHTQVNVNNGNSNININSSNNNNSNSNSVARDRDEVTAKLASLERIILDENEPIAKRTRSVFILKQMATPHAIDVLAKGLVVPSILLAHEIGYVLGQMGSAHACPHLRAVLADTAAHPVVRHECAEALGAIGDVNEIDFICKFIDDDEEKVEVRDTCKLTRDRLLWLRDHKHELSGIDNKHFYSVDPAPAFPQSQFSVSELSTMLTDPSLSLFQRYRAMFTLRNINTDEAVKALGAAAVADTTSAVFRHEIAYVFGQMQSEASVDALKQLLCRSGEHAMVRHEAAEALGAIANDEATEFIQKYGDDKDDIVRESCAVALDIADYYHDDGNYEDKFLLNQQH